VVRNSSKSNGSPSLIIIFKEFISYLVIMNQLKPIYDLIGIINEENIHYKHTSLSFNTELEIKALKEIKYVFYFLYNKFIYHNLVK
jgi:hypothetical protein